MPERRGVGFGRRDGAAPSGGSRPEGDVAPDEAPWPAGAVRLDEDLAASLLPERPVRGHKGAFGKLLVVAGSLDYAGAALLVCRAAGRAGAGLVTLAVLESLQPLFAAKVIEATTMALPEDDVEELDPEPAHARILDHEHDALVVGPGLRPGLATAELVRQLIGTSGGDATPILLDAEALRSLATMDAWWEGERRPAVLTPHVGEFERLRAGSGHDAASDGDLTADDDARVAACRDAAAKWGQVVVLKGARTVVASPDGGAAISPTGNPGMASGGTGDVLAGVVGALLAQGLPPFEAAALGVFAHGAAGDVVAARQGEVGLLAGDLIAELPATLARLQAAGRPEAPRRRSLSEARRLRAIGRASGRSEARIPASPSRSRAASPAEPCR